MTHDQLGACIKLQGEGKCGVLLPESPSRTPTPGLILFADDSHRTLELVQPDGTVVDLLAVLAAAEDCVRNWHDGVPPKLKLPQFVGDFGRLTKVAQVINGRKL